MTTIAYDGRTLAADRRANSSGAIRTVCKIFDCGEYVFAGTGVADESELIAGYIRKGFSLAAAKELDFSDENSYGIVVRKADGKCFCISGKHLTLVPILDEQFAMGSGRDFALSAMAFGKTAKEGVEFAMRFDAATGNGVDCYEFKFDDWEDEKTT
jgi:hypothetical protein